ncbi:response regulator [Compostibacter hankyongensis]|uniref:Response regulatory domain-containing protein n=1 Tax=Compostibacter hankyongensis TaxID=1007089 RepID=A0ABP8FP17_9BACT
MEEKKKILIIDDEEDLCLLLGNYLMRKQYEVYIAHTLKEGLAVLKEINPAILFLDNNLPDGMGWEKAMAFLEINPALQIHFISAYQHNTVYQKPGISMKIWEKPLSFRELDRYF